MDTRPPSPAARAWVTLQGGGSYLLEWDEAVDDGSAGEPSGGGRYAYTGQRHEPPIALYYYGARFYDPALGRFITQDPAQDGLNWYVYCENSPLRYVDPNGRKLQEATFVGRTSSSVMRLLDEHIVESFRALANEMEKAGITFELSDGFRENGKQRHFFAIKKSVDPKLATDAKRHGLGGVNPPGISFHEAGVAFDLAVERLTDEQLGEFVKSANKSGFYQTVKSEPWHFDYVAQSPCGLSESVALREAVAELLGYENWRAMVEENQADYRDKGYPAYQCPSGIPVE